MRRLMVVTGALSIALSQCSSDETPGNAPDGGSAGSSGASTGAAPSTGGASTGGKAGSGGATGSTGGSQTYPDAFDPNDSPPKIGERGCGFEKAAFCDTFGGPSTLGGRSRELDTIYWSASRMWGSANPTRAMPLGMARIPQCRPGLPAAVWTDQDTLICNPTNDIASGHLLAAVSAQNYGQHGYRIRQPFDFAGRTAKIVWDATAYPLHPQLGWVSMAVTEEPTSMPGYTIYSNDEGSVLPKNGVEVHFTNFVGVEQIKVRNIHVFRDFEDTVYPEQDGAATFKRGKLNHYEMLLSPDGVEVTISDYSEDGVAFGPAKVSYKVATQLPFTRGYVHVSVHNHADLKYTPGLGYDTQEDATVALIDNVGFDGNVIANWREYEIPDALVKFQGEEFQLQPDPYNTDKVGYEIGYTVGDVADGPKQNLTFKGVDTANVGTASLRTSFWGEYRTKENFAAYTLRARFNGKNWIERKFTDKEVALLSSKPKTHDPQGNPIGDPGSTGRFDLDFDVPLTDLVPGDNTVEFTTSGVPRGYPPLVCNVDLIMQTK